MNSKLKGSCEIDSLTIFTAINGNEPKGPFKLNARQIVIGSCYWPPNIVPKHFVKMHNQLLSTIFKCNRSVIKGIDHNLDLQKFDYHHNTQDFMETNLQSNLYLTIV